MRSFLTVLILATASLATSSLALTLPQQAETQDRVRRDQADILNRAHRLLTLMQDLRVRYHRDPVHFAGDRRNRPAFDGLLSAREN